MDAFTRDALADPALLTDRFLDEFAAALPPEAAAALADWRVSDELQAALTEYGARAGESELSREQAEGYDDYLRYMSVAGVLRAAAIERAGLLKPEVPPQLRRPVDGGDGRDVPVGAVVAP